MITDKIKELEKLRARAAEIEASVSRERAKELAGLPAQYGFDSVESFIKAVKAAAGNRGSAKAVRSAAPKRRKRAVITPQIKAKVVELAKAGKTGGEIAKACGISLPSVQNIKKAAGLVQKRK
jgi:hypothetical protein